MKAANISIAFALMLGIALIAGCSSVQHLTKQNVLTVKSDDGSSITYGVRGQGEVTMVFVHCWTCNHEFWKPQIEYFSKKHKVALIHSIRHSNVRNLIKKLMIL